jgi:hypothetical protein
MLGSLISSGFRAVAAGADGGDEGHAVFVRGARLEQFAGDAAGQFEDFLRVAVVDLEDGGAALGLDAEALEAEFAALFAAVDGLGVVVEDEQRVGARVDHLGDKLEFEAVCQAPLSARHARDAGADCRNQRSQGRPLYAFVIAELCHLKMGCALLFGYLRPTGGRKTVSGEWRSGRLAAASPGWRAILADF